MQLDLLDHLDLLHKEARFGDLPAITAHARQVLQEKFASGYFQDFPVEDRRAKEVELKQKRKRGGRGVKAPRLLGPRIGVDLDDDAEGGERPSDEPPLSYPTFHLFTQSPNTFPDYVARQQQPPQPDQQQPLEQEDQQHQV